MSAFYWLCTSTQQPSCIFCTGIRSYSPIILGQGGEEKARVKEWTCLRDAFEPHLLLTFHFVVVLYVSVLDSLATEV